MLKLKKPEKMKIRSIILTVAAASLISSSCTNLEEEFFNVVPASEYGTTSQEILTIAGTAYASLRGFKDDVSNAYFTSEYVYFLVECVSDEVCVPTRGADWYDNGRYQQAQYHEIQPDNAMVLSAWRYCYEGISKCNFVLYTIENAGLPEDEEQVAMAEIRGVRAYYYYLLLDWFGNVPISTSFTDLEMPANSPRDSVYMFVENELLDIRDDLQQEIIYGRFTQNVCNTLLARLYINSEVMIGTPRWQDCIDACDLVQGYDLEPRVLDNWLTENQNSEEIIFAIPFDNAEGTVGNYLPSLTFHYYHWQSVSTLGGPWFVNGICAQPGVYSSFEPGDERVECMAIGPEIHKARGDTIKDRTGAPLIYTENIIDYENALEYEGARLNKLETRVDEKAERDHDWVLMRYAEVLLMKAECLWRQGNAAAAKPLVTEIRRRSGLGANAAVDVTEEVLDMEWLHEFLFEGLRRNVNLRFGTYDEIDWPKLVNQSPDMEIFPIPETEIVKNSKLKQNPGYPGA